MKNNDSNKPRNDLEAIADSSDSILLSFDVRFDGIWRPRPPWVPRGFPPQARRGRPQPPPSSPEEQS